MKIKSKIIARMLSLSFIVTNTPVSVFATSINDDLNQESTKETNIGENLSEINNDYKEKIKIDNIIIIDEETNKEIKYLEKEKDYKIEINLSEDLEQESVEIKDLQYTLIGYIKDKSETINKGNIQNINLNKNLKENIHIKIEKDFDKVEIKVSIKELDIEKNKIYFHKEIDKIEKNKIYFHKEIDKIEKTDYIADSGSIKGLDGKEKKEVELNKEYSFNFNILNKPLNPFIKTIGGSSSDVLYGVIKSYKEGYITVGHTNSNDGDIMSMAKGDIDAMVNKLDNSGNVVWSKLVGGSKDDYYTGAINSLDKDGYIIAGYSASIDKDLAGKNKNSKGVGLITKFDDTGKVVFNKSFEDINNKEDIRIFKIMPMSDGYVVSGSVGTGMPWESANPFKGLVIKLDEDCNKVWEKRYGGTKNDMFEMAIGTKDNGVIAVGKGYSTNGDLSSVTRKGGGEDAYIVKYNKNGTIEWKKSFGGSQNDSFRAVTETSNGDYIAVGYTCSKNYDLSGIKTSTYQDALIVKYDRNGNVIWKKVLGGSGTEYLLGVEESTDGGYVISGFSNSKNGDFGSMNNGEEDAVILKIDDSGNVIWKRCFGGSKAERLRGIAALQDGAYVIAGNTFSNDYELSGKLKGSDDGLVVKFNEDGSLDWKEHDEIISEIKYSIEAKSVSGRITKLKEGSLKNQQVLVNKNLKQEISFTMNNDMTIKELICTVQIVDNEDFDNSNNTLTVTVPVNSGIHKDLKLTTVAKPEGNYMNLKWTFDTMNVPHKYKVYKREKNEDTFQTISTTNLNDTKKINVLNIYPVQNEHHIIPNLQPFTTYDGEYITNLPKSAILKKWIEEPIAGMPNGSGRGLIEVIPVALNEFNKNPDKYLKNESGEYKIDVIYEGDWDAHAQQDLSAEGLKAINEFVDTGRGYLAGHDSMWLNPTRGTLAEKTNTLAKYSGNLGHSSQIGNSKVEIMKNGILTNYPWKLGNVGDVLNIPFSHSTDQFGFGDTWFSYVVDETMMYASPEWTKGVPSDKYIFKEVDGRAGTNLFYLHTYNNFGVIQTGHLVPHSDREETTIDEKKIIANALFYLNQLMENKELNDMSAQDVDAPDIPYVNSIKKKAFSNDVEINMAECKDNGTTYEHYVEAIETKTDNEYRSNITSTEIVTGFEGYSYEVDTNPDTEPDNTIDIYSNSFSVKRPVGELVYLHIKSIDKAGNVSKTTHIELQVSSNNISVSHTQSETNWTNKDVTVNLMANSTAGFKQIIGPDGKSRDFEYTKMITYGGEKTENFNSVAATSDGGFIAAGLKGEGDVIGVGNVNLYTDALIVKYDKNGKLQWSKTWGASYGGESFWGVEEIKDSNGNPVGYIAVGEERDSFISAYGTYLSHAVAVKFDLNGNFVWKSKYNFDAGQDSIFWGVTVDSKNRILAVGYRNEVGDADYLIRVIEDKGSYCTKRDIVGDNDNPYTNVWLDERIDRIIEKPGEGYFVVGSRHDWNASRRKYDSNMGILYKLDYNFDVVYKRNFKGKLTLTSDYISPGVDFDNVFVASDGNLIVLGDVEVSPGNDLTEPAKGDKDAFIVKYNSMTGSVIWQKRIGGTMEDVALGVEEIKGPNNKPLIFITGATQSRGGDFTGTFKIGMGYEDVYTATLDLESGRLIGNINRFGGDNIDMGWWTTKLKDGRMLVCGATTSVIDSNGLPVSKGYADAFISIINTKNMYNESFVVTQNNNFMYTFKDINDEVSEYNVRITNIDKYKPYAPSISMQNGTIIIKDNGDYDGPRNAKSGIKEIMYKIDDGSWIKYTGAIIKNPSYKRIYAKVIDNATNESAETNLNLSQDFAVESYRIENSKGENVAELKIGETFKFNYKVSNKDLINTFVNRKKDLYKITEKSNIEYDEILDKATYTIWSSTGLSDSKDKIIKSGTVKDVKTPINDSVWLNTDFLIPKDNTINEIIFEVKIEDSNDYTVANNTLRIKLPVWYSIESDIGIKDDPNDKEDGVTIYPVGDNNTSNVDDDCYVELGAPIIIKATIGSTNIKTQNIKTNLIVNDKVVESKTAYGVSVDYVGTVYYNYSLDKFDNKGVSSQTLKVEIEVEPEEKEDFLEEIYINKSKPVYIKVVKNTNAEQEDRYTKKEKTPSYDIGKVVGYLKVKKTDKTKLIIEPCGKLCQEDDNNKLFCPGHREYVFEEKSYPAYIPIGTHSMKGIKEEINISSVKFRSKYTKGIKDDSSYSNIVDKNTGFIELIDASTGKQKNGINEYLKVKSGYGFELEVETEYKNNLPKVFEEYVVRNTAPKDTEWCKYEAYNDTNVDVVYRNVDKELSKKTGATAFVVPSMDDIGIYSPNRHFAKTPSSNNEYLDIDNGLKLVEKTEPSIDNVNYVHKNKFKLVSKSGADKYYVHKDTKNGNYEFKIFTPRFSIGALCDSNYIKIKDEELLSISIYGGYLDDIKTQLNE